ncbi:efflux RND transporter periplasmic adaptor subunit [Luteimonas aestuarii]|uniref:Efflux RND transporter periplasmic adaptor subunit n=1 Tax=Luteimonas aestuarii TaxID=453837 RepID=A0A4V3AM13_9GAMM|nr:efflux RND transporter periplasmic adaptor subunit [Luteimonas aestuarii]TDK19406.1 efflux RND transporter periplasmic adaptor subunit [Luteimonas aestuarii]
MAKPSSTRKPNLPLRMILMLVLTLLVVGGLFAVKAFFGAQTNKFFDNMPQPAVAVTTYEAAPQAWSTSLEAVGTLVAVNGTDVTTEAGGVVRRIAFEAGQPVRAGALLVELNSANELATLKSLEASAQLAGVQANRWQQLAGDQLVSAAEAEERTTSAATARAAVDAQRALIAQKTVRAPFDGVLGIRRVNLGQFVAPGDAIVSLQSLDPIYLDFTLPEQHLPAIAEGTPINATVDAIPGETFGGTITAIEPSVDASTRNFRVQATLRNPDGALRPGTFARVSFAMGGPSDVVVIPQTAVSFNPYGNAVYVISEVDREPGERDMQGNELTGKKFVARQRFITTGATRGDLVAVTDGLKPGETVATSGLLKLRNDAEVTINNTVQPSADDAPAPANR